MSLPAKFGPVYVNGDRTGAYVWLWNWRGLAVDSPRRRPLFSERQGLKRPLVRWRGWRLWVLK